MPPKSVLPSGGRTGRTRSDLPSTSRPKRTTTRMTAATTATTTAATKKSSKQPSAADILEALKSVERCSPILVGSIASIDLPPERRASFAKQVVNSTLALLNTAVQQGWKLSGASQDAKSVRAVADCFNVATRMLRSMGAGANIGVAEVESVAVTVVRKLVFLELHDAALRELSDIAPRLQSLYYTSHCANTTTSKSPPSYHLLSFPLPGDTSLTFAVWALVYECQQLGVASLLNGGTAVEVAPLVEALRSPEGPLAWRSIASTLPTDAKSQGTADRLTVSLERTISRFLSSSASASLLPSDSLALRVFSLQLLLTVSEVDPEPWWSRALRAGASHWKLTVASGLIEDAKERERKAFRQIDSAFDLVLAAVQDARTTFRPVSKDAADQTLDRRVVRMDQGKAFVAFCEYWLSLARRSGSLSAVDKVARLIQGDQDNTDLSMSETEKTAMDADRRTARSCALLIKCCACLDEWFKDGGNTSDVSAVLKSSMSALATLHDLVNHFSDDQLKKVDRSVDSLRRRCIRVISPDPTGSSPAASSDEPTSLKSEASEVLEATADVLLKRFRRELERPRSPRSSPADGADGKKGTERMMTLEDLASDGVQALRCLAITRFSVTDHQTHNAALQLLGRCEAFLPGAWVERNSRTGAEVVGPGDVRLDSKVLADNLAYVSSSYYNMGGRLYQVRSVGAALPFLRRAAEMTEQEVDLRKTVAEEEGTAEKDVEEEGSKRRRDLSKRWEHMAVCCRGIGDNKSAHESYRRAIVASLCAANANSRLVEMIRKRPISAAFVEGFAHLGSLIKSCTEMAAFDLLWTPAQVSLSEALHASGQEAEVIGAVVEWQVASLDERLYRPEAGHCVVPLLQDCLKAYDLTSMPVRRARVLVRLMEHSCMTSRSSERNVSLLGNDASSLLKRQDLAVDVGLAAFGPQYLAASYVWQAADCHYHGETADAIDHARLASQILESFVSKPATPSPVQPKRRGLTTVQTKGAATARRLVPSSSPRPIRKTRAAPPRTPPARVTKAQAASSSAVLKSNCLNRFDDIERFYGHLELLSELFHQVGQPFLRIKLLKLMRSITQTDCIASTAGDRYLRASCDLARQYLALGKSMRAGAVIGKAAESARDQPVQDDTKIRCALVFAEYLACTDNLERSIAVYTDAQAMAETASATNAASTVQRVTDKTKQLSRAALAAEIHSIIQRRKGDISASITSAAQSLRLSVRAASNLARLVKTPSTDCKPAALKDPFSSEPIQPDPQSQKSDVQTVQQPSVVGPVEGSKRLNPFANIGVSCLHWQTSHAAFSAYLRLSELYSCRGSSRDAEAFANEAVDFATAHALSSFRARALSERAGLKLEMHNLEDGQADLQAALQALSDRSGTEAAKLSAIQADLNARCEAVAEATSALEAAEELLQALDRAYTETEAILPTPRKSPVAARRSSTSDPVARHTISGQDGILPKFRCQLLRRRALLLRALGKKKECRRALDLLSRLATDADSKAVADVVLGELALDDVFAQLEADRLLSILPESTMSVPSVSPKGTITGSKAILATLSEAEASLARALSFGSNRFKVTDVRPAALSEAYTVLLQAVLGKSSKFASFSVSHFLGQAPSIGLQREFLEAIDSKLKEDGVPDDLVWPIFEQPLEAAFASLHLTASSPLASGDDEDEEEEQSERSMRQYWVRTRERHQTLFEQHPQEVVDIDLPPNWIVVSVNVMVHHKRLLLARHQAGKEPLVFSLPLDRFAKREGEEDDVEDQPTVEKVLAELHDIVKTCNRAVHGAKDLQGMDARRAWWTERRELDSRLGTLLQTIEQKWLGAFKSIFCEPPTTDAGAQAALRTRFDEILKKGLPGAHEGKKASRVRLQDDVFECFSALPPGCEDEELEDLLYFLMDVYQLNGVPIACDEVDLDTVCLDLRSALEEFHAKNKESGTRQPDRHVILVLDKDMSPIPWESMPVLRNQAVSRVPSLAFLQDRLFLARHLKEQHTERSSERRTLDEDGDENEGGADDESSRATQDPTLCVDVRRTFYVLNPSGDLKHSEERFSPWLNSKRAELGWAGITGRAPRPDEFTKALERNDLVLYFGHSGAEQYARTHKIRSLRRCATTMLWGCSSGLLRDAGDFDRTGTPWNYMLAGCPALVANLWDTTDRELDSVSESVFSRIGLGPSESEAASPKSEERRSAGGGGGDAASDCRRPSSSRSGSNSSGAGKEGWSRRGGSGGGGGGGGGRMSLVRAVAQARGDCRLPYLTGAAVVVYGVPVYFDGSTR